MKHSDLIFNIEEALLRLQKNTEEILPIGELRRKLLEKKKMIVKLGADPTAPHIHLGHIIVLEKLRDFQHCGCEIVFLIGDFTAQIGDPTGKSKTRPPLTLEQIAQNVQTYLHQISRIIDINKTNIVYNATWFSHFSSAKWIELCAKVTLAQIIERDDFAKRLQGGVPIGMHELLYPLLQGYDSVYLQADVEIGGTDQKFNMLMGRKLQEAYGQEPQVIITMPILPGIDGVQKMSKSLGNDIALTDSPKDVFLKIMSINDDLMIIYFDYLLGIAKKDCDLLISEKSHMEAKKILARGIIAKYWSQDEAEQAYCYFTEVFQKKVYNKSNLKQIEIREGSYQMIDFIVMITLDLSRTEIRRLISAGAISINGIKIKDLFYIYNPLSDDVIKIGKQVIYSLIVIKNEHE